jgi:hypothetical protein
MTFPTVPQRSRKSGELTFVRFVAVGDPDRGAHIIDAHDATTTPGTIEFQVDDTHNYVAGGNVFVVGADDALFNGYHVILEVTVVAKDDKKAKKDVAVKATPGVITTATLWPTALTGTVTMPESATIYNVSDFVATGQATDTSGGSSGETDTWSTIGVEDEDISTGTTYDVSMTLYVDDDLAIGRLLGYGEIVGVPDVVELDESKQYHVHVILETYSSRNRATAELLYANVYEFVKWDSWNTPNAAGSQSYGQWELSGSTKRKYVAKPRA